MKFNEFKSRVEALKNLDTIEIIETICDELDENEIYDHMEHVANLAAELAEHYKLNQDDAFLTGFLHDIGRLIEPSEYLEILTEYNIEVSEDDLKVPDVLHGKVASIITSEIFGIKKETIKLGILYHTTLRKNPTDFEKVIFLADKLTWTYDDLIYRVEETVTQSLNVACYNALTWIIEHIKSEDGIVLDVTQEAYLYFKGSMLF